MTDPVLIFSGLLCAVVFIIMWRGIAQQLRRR